MVVAYELFLAAKANLPAAESRLASAEDLEGLYRHLQETLLDLGFLHDANQEHMMFSLRQLFGRARLEDRDINILRGILGRVDRISKYRN
jgi:tRNA C32,U32 (ribose-2'-O)-methylase TrmJ